MFKCVTISELRDGPHIVIVNKVKCREGLRMLLLCHAIIPCVHTGIVIYPFGSVNSELRTIHVMLFICHAEFPCVFSIVSCRHRLYICMALS